MTIPPGRAYIYQSTGSDSSNFSWVTDYRVKSVLGSKEVVVKPVFSGLNPLDYKVPSMPPFWVLFKGKPVGHDVCGTVVAVGKGVTEFKEGDVVFGHAPGLCDFTITSVDKIAKVPTSINDIVPFGGICAAGCTAIQMLRKANGFQGPAKRIMIIGASGGVGSLAVQIAREICPAGTHIIAVCSSRSAEYVKSIGANQIVDYTAPGFRFGLCVERESLDIILDCVSSPDDYNYVPEGMGLIKPGTGQYVASNTANVSEWARSGIETFTGVKMFWGRYHLIMVQPNTADLNELASLVQNGKLVIHVDEVFKFEPDSIRSALEKLSRRHVRGKLIVKH